MRAGKDFVVAHALDQQDAVTIASMWAAARPTKGMRPGKEARESFDALMESVPPCEGVTFESATIGGVPGIWVHPARYHSEEALLHLHAGWFTLGSAKAFRNLVGHLAARVGARAFIPDYRLAPEHPFPAAVEDAQACYRGFDDLEIKRVAVTGDSAGGNLALVLASSATNDQFAKAKLMAVAVVSPVTDLTLASATYETRAEADPYFTRAQVTQLVESYLAGADPRNPNASPIEGGVADLPPVSIHVGDAEVLLGDSRRFFERALNAGVDARLDVWLGMPHGFIGSIGRVKAATQALDLMGKFLSEKLRARDPAYATQ